MRIQVLSVHPLGDNRISKHIKTLIDNNYSVEYINASDSHVDDFNYRHIVLLKHYPKSFNQHSIFRMISIYFFMIKYLFKTDAEIVHIHDIYLLPLISLAKRRGKITIFDKHETFEKINGFYSKFFTYYEKKIVNSIDGIVYTAEQQKEFIEMVGYKNSVHIPNYQSKLAYQEVKNHYQLNEKIQLVYIGSLSEKDRQILLMLDVFEKAMSANSHIYCTLGGKVGKDVVSEKIEYLANRYKEQFTYVGYIPYNKVIEINRNSDIGLLFFKNDPNTYNSSSNKLYEYLLSGLVFIGIGKFVLDEEITKHNAGKIFDFQVTAEEICDYILELSKNKDELNLIRINSARLGMNYCWESIEKRYIELYHTILGEIV